MAKTKSAKKPKASKAPKAPQVKKPRKPKTAANQDDTVPTVPFRDHSGNVAPSTEFPAHVPGLLQDGYSKTHMAANGNALYTRHHPTHGHVFAEVDDEGKVVEVRTIQHVPDETKV